MVELSPLTKRSRSSLGLPGRAIKMASSTPYCPRRRNTGAMRCLRQLPQQSDHFGAAGELFILGAFFQEDVGGTATIKTGTTGEQDVIGPAKIGMT